MRTVFCQLNISTLKCWNHRIWGFVVHIGNCFDNVVCLGTKLKWFWADSDGRVGPLTPLEARGRHRFHQLRSVLLLVVVVVVIIIYPRQGLERSPIYSSIVAATGHPQ